ncbi:MAG TPA: bb3-type cytochrome oxidase subunit IV, partial [Pseudomonas sp.]|nr:bb3-type cytochrome oxidase subunit IV [Pseudomonas sp.]
MASHPQAPSESSSTNPPSSPLAPGWEGIASDWASDREAFKQVPWGKAMMWIFLLSDTFIFTCFLTGYMSVRMTIT